MLQLSWISQLEETIRNCISPLIVFVSVSLLLFYFLNILPMLLSKEQMEIETCFASDPYTTASLNFIAMVPVAGPLLLVSISCSSLVRTLCALNCHIPRWASSTQEKETILFDSPWNG